LFGAWDVVVPTKGPSTKRPNTLTPLDPPPSTIDHPLSMNYFAHGLHYLDRPLFLAGTAVPDWMSVADRAVRVRPKLIEPLLADESPDGIEILAGMLQHFLDDDWFHATPAFAITTAELTVRFAALAPDDDARHAAHTRALEVELTRTLTARPDVLGAEAWLTLPDEARSPLDAPLPRATALITLTVRAEGPSRGDVQALLERLLARRDVDLTLERRVLAPPARTTTPLASVGPFRVEARDALALRLTLALSLCANALLALLLLGRRRRGRSTARTQF